MENWGLVSFREDRIIFDDKIASTYQKQRLAETMSHELAHFCTFSSLQTTNIAKFFLFQGSEITSHANGGMIYG